MALLNTIDPDDAQARLERWLARAVPAPDVVVSNVEIPHAAGFSMTTILFDAEWTTDGRATGAELVARVAPTTLALFERPDLAREFAILAALGEHTTAPVPAVRWFEPDTSVLGSPFLVMDRVQGRVPSDDPPYPVTGWVTELTARERAMLLEGTVRAIADVHASDWKTLGLMFLDDEQLGEPGISQQMRHLERTYAWAHGGDRSPTIDAALEELARRIPTDAEELVVNWGDARLGNVIFDAETNDVRALLDWEMATLASPEMDLGWLLFFVRYYTEGIGVEPLPGFQTREELIALYESASGRTVRHIEFYEAFAAARASVLMLRVGRLMVEAGAVPADSPMPLNNPASQLLAKLLELPAPEGHTSSFVGNR